MTILGFPMAFQTSFRQSKFSVNKALELLAKCYHSSEQFTTFLNDMIRPLFMEDFADFVLLKIELALMAYFQYLKSFRSHLVMIDVLFSRLD